LFSGKSLLCGRALPPSLLKHGEAFEEEKNDRKLKEDALESPKALIKTQQVLDNKTLLVILFNVTFYSLAVV